MTMYIHTKAAKNLSDAGDFFFFLRRLVQLAKGSKRLIVSFPPIVISS